MQGRAVRAAQARNPAAGPGGAGRRGSPGGHLTVPLVTLLGLGGRPGEIPRIGPIDPGLARDLARAAAQNPDDHVVRDRDRPGRRTRSGHGCARPEPKSHSQTPRETRETRRRQTDTIRPAAPATTSGPGFTFTVTDGHEPPGTTSNRPAGRVRLLAVSHRRHPDSGTGTSRSTRSPAGDCDHRFEAEGPRPRGQAPHLAQIRHATCTGPVCRRPAATVRLRAQHPLRGRRGSCCVTAVRSAVTTTGSNSTPGGTSTSSPAAPSGGPPRPAGSAPPKPPSVPDLKDQRRRGRLCAEAAES